MGKDYVLVALRDMILIWFFFQAEGGIRDIGVTGVQTCALPIWIARSRPRTSGEVIRLPFDCSGLAPSINTYPVRSRSGTGTVVPVPNISALAICLGYWSTVLAEYRLRVPTPFSSTRP